MKVLLQSYNYYVENSNLVSSCKRLIHIIFFCKEFDTYQFIIQKHEQLRSGLYPDLVGSPLHDRVARTRIQPGRHSTQGREPARPRRPVTLQMPCASSRRATGKGLPPREQPHRGRGRTASGPATRGRRAAVRHRSELQGRVAYSVRARRDAGWRTTRPWAEPPSRPSARVLCVPSGLMADACAPKQGSHGRPALPVRWLLQGMRKKESVG